MSHYDVHDFAEGLRSMTDGDFRGQFVNRNRDLLDHTRAAAIDAEASRRGFAVRKPISAGGPVERMPDARSG